MEHIAIAGFVSALALAHAIIAAHGVSAYLRRKTEVELLLFGLLNAALVAFDAGYALAFSGKTDVAWSLFIGEAGRLGATAFLFHFVLVYTRQERKRRILTILYAACVLLEGANALGIVHRYSEAKMLGIRLLGISLPDLVLPSGPLGAPMAAARVACVLFAILVTGRSVLEGRHGGLAFAGATLLGVTAIHDSLHALGLVPGPPFSAIGFAGFVLGVLLTFVSQYSSVRQGLEAKTSELKRRSRELSRSYDELRAAQSELVRKEQLAAVGELSAVIAHEVRNPLAIIANAVATLRRGQIEAQDRDTLLGILDEEASRLNHLVGDLLRYARPINLQRQLISVRDIVERALGLARVNANVQSELYEPKQVARIWGDANLLRQAIENLITNAVQAMAGGGVLTLTLAALDVEGTGGVELQIQDTGEGMDTQVRNRALDPFFTTRPSGTGLGLAIVARIIDAHGGTLRIKSAAGAGTIVHVFLPVSVEPGKERPLEPLDRTSEPPLPAEVLRAMGKRR